MNKEIYFLAYLLENLGLESNVKSPDFGMLKKSLKFFIFSMNLIHMLWFIGAFILPLCVIFLENK